MIRLLQPQAVSNLRNATGGAVEKALTMIQTLGILEWTGDTAPYTLTMTLKEAENQWFDLSHVQVVGVVSYENLRTKDGQIIRFQKEAGTTTPEEKQSTLRRYIPTRLS